MTKYDKIDNNIHKLIIDNPKTKGGAVTWLNVINPRKKEIEYIRKKYNFNLSHLQASSAKAKSQRPSIEQENKDYLFLILHFPVFDIEENIKPAEIEFFVGKNYIITLHDNKLKSLNEFFSLCKKDEKSLLAHSFESSSVLLYEILERMMQSCFLLLDQNSIIISDLEEIIFKQFSKRSVSKILALQRNIINTRKIMQNHKNIIKKLAHFQTGLVPKNELHHFYNKLLDHSKRFWENLDNQKEMVDVLNNTNDALLNYRISDIMKTLTIFSVIVFPLTLLAAIFGMNTMNGMPLIDTPNGFWIIIAIMLTGSLTMLLFFAKKKWL